MTSAMLSVSPNRNARPVSSDSKSGSQPRSSRAQAAIRSASGSWRRSSASIAFGGTFHTRLNHSTKMSTSARRAGSCGHRGGSGTSCSSRRRIAGESDDHLAVRELHDRHELLPGQRSER